MTVPDESVKRRVGRIMEAHWSGFGYTVPNLGRYPFQWLWDSCFHSLVWAALGDDRCIVELSSVFRHQAESGFVPHVTYDGSPGVHESFWGRAHTSSITQPPMFGHAIAELVRRGFDVEESLIERATLGIGFLLHGRARVDGLVAIVHPWESGADNSPRWDDWFGGGWDAVRWWEGKGKLVETIELGADGSALANPAFAAASAGFNALVAFNALELAEVTGCSRLRQEAEELVASLDSRWDDDLRTWVDAGAAAQGSGRIRVLDALLPALVCERGLPDEIDDPAGYGTAFGPSGVHLGEPAYDPGAYWRGSAWPQLMYLLAVAARRRGDSEGARRLQSSLLAGAIRSGFAEHWNAEDGAALGAVPQSWTGLAIVPVEGW